MPRFYCPIPLTPGQLLDLPTNAARHVQVLRLQPGGLITLFNGQSEPNGGEFEATITRMGRNDVQVQVRTHNVVEREAACAVHLVLSMPANERMDWLVEKATELGVASIQPLMSERSVLRLSGERAAKKVAHWQSIAVAACEQSGRNQVPPVHAVMTLVDWLRTSSNGLLASSTTQAQDVRLLLSLQGKPRTLRELSARKVTIALSPVEASQASSFTFLSGPEGGLSAAEEAAALAAGFTPVTLGPRVLRAETAPLAALAALTLAA